MAISSSAGELHVCDSEAAVRSRLDALAREALAPGGPAVKLLDHRDPTEPERFRLPACVVVSRREDQGGGAVDAPGEVVARVFAWRQLAGGLGGGEGERRRAAPAAGLTMPFGRHKGEPLDKVPLDYLRWLKANVRLKSGLRKAVRDRLAKATKN